jgi:protein-tyrosine-phosphatase
VTTDDDRLAGSVLFVCTMNSIRSPIAEALLKQALAVTGHRTLFVDSAGVQIGDIDGFAVAVMDEIGIDLQRHNAKDLVEAEVDSYDLVIALSEPARHKTTELLITAGSALEYWPVSDPSEVEGKRETRLAAYRKTRDEINKLIEERFFSQNS